MANEIDYTTPYVTKDEYLMEKGVNLTIELQDDDNKSNKVYRFIKDMTNFVLNYLVTNYACNELNLLINDFADLKEFRRKRFHRGMIEQIDYILNNGLIHLDSGIDKNTGAILDFSNVTIGQSAMLEFKLGAFCNINGVGAAD